MSSTQTITTKQTAEKLVGKRVKSKQTLKHKLAATEQTDCRNCWKTFSPSSKTSLSGNGNNAKGDIGLKHLEYLNCEFSEDLHQITLPTLSEISLTEYVRQPQIRKRDYKNWPSDGSRFLEYAEYGYFTLLFCDLL